MKGFLTIVMYHYVRDLERTPYPEIKGLTTKNFIGQLGYIQKHYKVVSMQSCVDAYLGNAELPDEACLLTFDDGFIDHYLTVFPLLCERGLSGAFFPPAQAILKRVIPDVHKIHFILASTKDYVGVTNQIFVSLRKFRGDHKLPTDSELYSKLAIPSRFDPAEVVFIKRLLQLELPEHIRSSIIDDLFTTTVTEDQETFAEGLYMNLGNLKLMTRGGMYIGGHGYRHNWVGHLTKAQQRQEISLTVDFLRQVYNDEPRGWVMSYPYGDWNESLINLLKEYDCAAGLTTKVDLAPVDPKERFFLPRLDTNDLPFSQDTPACYWTTRR